MTLLDTVECVAIAAAAIVFVALLVAGALDERQP